MGTDTWANPIDVLRWRLLKDEGPHCNTCSLRALVRKTTCEHSSNPNKSTWANVRLPGSEGHYCCRNWKPRA